MRSLIDTCKAKESDKNWQALPGGDVHRRGVGHAKVQVVMIKDGPPVMNDQSLIFS